MCRYSECVVFTRPDKANFVGYRYGMTANNAYAFLDQELACASRDFTNPANARKTGVWGIVSSRIETKYFFEQTIEGFDEICEEYDKTRESDAAGEEGSQIKERKAAEAAAKVLKAKRAALYSSAEAHSAKGATFFVRGSDNKSGLEKFTSYSTILARTPEKRAGGYKALLNGRGVEKVRGLIPLSFMEDIFVQMDALGVIVSDEQQDAAARKDAAQQAEVLEAYFGGDLWTLGAPSVGEQPLGELSRAISVYRL